MATPIVFFLSEKLKVDKRVAENVSIYTINIIIVMHIFSIINRKIIVGLSISNLSMNCNLFSIFGGMHFQIF